MTAPFILPRRTPTKQIDSTPLMVYGSNYGAFIDGIWVCNTNDNNIFISFNTLDERNIVSDSYQIINNFVLQPYESKELLNGAVLTMQPGDLLYANSSFAGDTFDCHVSYRELEEVTI